MSEAPEKIRTNAAGNAIVTPHPVWDTDVEYIRADVAQAMVTKAREDREMFAWAMEAVAKAGPARCGFVAA